MNLAKKKIAVITGGTSGIGLAVCRELLSLDYFVFILGRRKNFEPILNSKFVGSFQYISCDVSQIDQVKGAFALIAQTTEAIDFLFNNAGMGYVVSIADTTFDMWTETINTNLTGTFLITRQALPFLARSNHATILNNASIAAHRSFENFAAYSAAKAGVVSFSNILREEVRKLGIHVCILNLGATDTGFWDGVEGDWDRAKMMRSDDVARAIINVVNLPKSMQLENLTIMPAGGAL